MLRHSATFSTNSEPTRRTKPQRGGEKQTYARVNKTKKFRNITFLFLGCHLIPLNTSFSFSQDIGEKKEEG